MPAPANNSVTRLASEAVDAIGELSGRHPGYRAAHAKGTLCAGSFTPSAEARELTYAEHLRGGPVRVSARFSNGSGDPQGSDAAPLEGRGMAVKLYLDGGATTDIVGLTLPVFLVRTPEDFVAFTAARKPDPATGAPDQDRLDGFLSEHPETQAALALTVPVLAPPVSYATCGYNSLHAYRFSNEAGERCHIRYRWEPEAGEARLPEEERDGAGRDYLQDEIRDRLGRGPVGFRLVAAIADEGDPVDDPTVAWPEERRQVELGRLELSGLDETREQGDDVLVFDPTRVTPGIECSDDPILRFRTHAYSVSVERRSGVPRPEDLV